MCKFGLEQGESQQGEDMDGTGGGRRQSRESRHNRAHRLEQREPAGAREDCVQTRTFRRSDKGEVR